MVKFLLIDGRAAANFVAVSQQIYEILKRKTTGVLFLTLNWKHWLPTFISINLKTCWISQYLSRPTLVGHTVSQTSSPSSGLLCLSLHSSTWSKCMLVLVAPVAMLLSTGLSGWVDLWCSAPREISSQRWCLLLLSLQYPGLSQGNPLPS